MTHSRKIFNHKQAQEKVSHCSKKQKKEKKKRGKNSKIEKFKDVGHLGQKPLKILISAHAQAKML